MTADGPDNLFPFAKQKGIVDDKSFLSGEMFDLGSRIQELEIEARNVKFVLNIGQYLMFCVVIVLFVAFLGFLYDYLKFKGQSYDKLVNSVEVLQEGMDKSHISVDLSVKEIPESTKIPRFKD